MASSKDLSSSGVGADSQGYIDYSHGEPKKSPRHQKVEPQLTAVSADADPFVDHDPAAAAAPRATVTAGPKSLAQRTANAGSGPAAEDGYIEYSNQPRGRAPVHSGAYEPQHPLEDVAGPAAAGKDEEGVEYVPTVGQDHVAPQDGGNGNEPYFDPTFEGVEEEGPLEGVWFPHEVKNYGHFGFFNRIRVEIRQLFSHIFGLIALNTIIIAAYARYLNPFKKSPKRASIEREWEHRITGERYSGRVEYYAEFWGYECETHDVVTPDGWILKLHHITDRKRRPDKPQGYPVLIQHGILCNSANWVVNEERSLAFWLVDQGYDVWLSNIRANFGAGHKTFSRNDPRFWAWGLKEIALDLEHVVNYVLNQTSQPKLAYVGHSQGCGSMFLALSKGMIPHLGRKLSCFVALGPAVYAGPVLRKFPFSVMRQLRGRRWWASAFGVRSFMPWITLAQKMLPAFLFGHIGYVTFAFLFGFHDANFTSRQKPKFFRTLPMATSSELLYWYMSGFSHRGCIFDPRINEPWFPSSFPPLSVYYGSTDYLVLGKPLVQRIERRETNVRMVHAVELEGYEHMDMIWGVDCHKTVFPGIKDTIETTRDR